MNRTRFATTQQKTNTPSKCIGLLFAGVMCALGCSSNGGGGGADGSVPENCTTPQDNNQTPSQATVLSAETNQDEYICPSGDRDVYRITMPAAEKVLNLSLEQAATISTVALTYRILDSNETPLYTAPVPKKAFFDSHCLEPGDYFIVVEDSGNDAADGTNPYRLRYETNSEGDANESNNDKDNATPLTSTSGTISCLGDKDYYSVVAPGGKLIEVSLTTAQPVATDLRLDLYDSSDTLLRSEIYTGSQQQTISLATQMALPQADTYYLVVSDNQDNATSAEPYSLTATLQDELDAYDQVPGRNDTPATASTTNDASQALNYSGGTPASPWDSGVITGQIGSRGDVDYFKLDGIAFDANTPGVMEITVDFGGPVDLQPQVGLIYPDALSTCTSDACCSVLQPRSGNTGCSPSSIGGGSECLGRSYSCITKGDVYCANCETNASVFCPAEPRCAGTAQCLPNHGSGRQCGAEMVTVEDNDGDPKTADIDGRILTVVPILHPGPWYIRVGDRGNNEYAYGTNYTLRVRIAPDPDGSAEWDNEFIPPQILVTSSNEGTIYGLHRQKRNESRVPSGSPATEIVVEGYLSYGRDVDYFYYPHPCPDAITDTGVPVADRSCTVEYLVEKIGSNCPPDLEFIFRVSKGGSDLDQFGLLSGQSSYTYGPAADGATHTQICSTYRNAFSDNWIRIEEEDRTDWSWTCGYKLTIRGIQQGCPTGPTDRCGVDPNDGRCCVRSGNCPAP